MKLLRILFGILLIFVICSINGFRGYVYMFGAQLQVAFKGDYENDPRYLVTTDTDGGKHITTANKDAHLSLLADSKFWAIGWGLIILSFMQFIGGILLIIRNHAGLILTAFLLLTAILGLSIETIEGIHKSAFGIMNWINGVSSCLLILLTLTIINKPKDVQGNSPQ